jgi:hypothetical protein
MFVEKRTETESAPPPKHIVKKGLMRDREDDGTSSKRSNTPHPE